LRQRGKAMTVAPHLPLRENRQERLQRLQPAIDQLVMAARQLELGTEDVVKSLRRAMEEQGDS
jgi:GntR family transcriptional regulator